MNIKFKHIKIENFLSLGKVELDIDSRGYVLVSGVNKSAIDSATSNGSGKSSLWEALVYGVTGDTIRGITKIVNVNASDGALVDITFDVDGVPYRILRSKDHSQWKTIVKLWINGEDKSGKGIRETEKLIAEYLPDLSPQIIGSVVVLGQGLPQRFTNNTPAGRKEVLEKLTKSDYMIEDLKNRITDRRTKLTAEINALDVESASIQGQIKSIDEQITEAQSVINSANNIDNLRDSIDAREASLELLQGDYNAISETIEKEVAQSAEYGKQCAEIDSALKVRLAEVEKTWLQMPISSEIIELQGRQKYVKAEYDRIKNLGDVCPTCGQPVPEEYKGNLMSYDLELEEIDIKLNEALAKKQEILEAKKNKEEELKSRAKRAKDEIESKNSLILKQNLTSRQNRRNIEDELTKVRVSLSAIKSEYDKARSLRQNAEDTIKTLTAKKEALNNTLLYNEMESHTRSEHLAVLSKFNSAITREFRGYLLGGIIEYIDKTAKQYAKSAFGNDNIAFELDKNNISVKFNDKEYESLSGGEKQKIDVIIQLALRNVLCSFLKFSTNIIVIDEVFDNLDALGCQQVIDLITNELRDVSSVYIVTHHASDLAIPYDDEIIVVKNTAGISEI